MNNLTNIMCGEDVIIHNNAYFTRPKLVKIGNHVAIDYGFYCTSKLDIADYVHISSHVSIIGGAKSSLTIEDFCFISTGSRIVCSSDRMLGDGLINPFIPNEYQDSKNSSPVIIRRFAGISANAVLLPGVEMAEGSVLGANSMLKESTEPWTIYAGSPAKPIKKRKKDIMYLYAKKMGYSYE